MIMFDTRCPSVVEFGELAKSIGNFDRTCSMAPTQAGVIDFVPFRWNLGRLEFPVRQRKRICHRLWSDKHQVVQDDDLPIHLIRHSL